MSGVESKRGRAKDEPGEKEAKCGTAESSARTTNETSEIGKDLKTLYKEKFHEESSSKVESKVEQISLEKEEGLSSDDRTYNNVSSNSKQQQQQQLVQQEHLQLIEKVEHHQQLQQQQQEHLSGSR